MIAQLQQELPPLIACLGIMLIPIVAILTSHQRKMAEIIHGRQQQQLGHDPLAAQRMSAIEHELAEVKELLKSQTIALDNLASRQTQASSSVEQRSG